MSGRSKKKRAKRKAKKAEKESAFAMAETNWQNMGQWQHDATASRDKNVQGINQKYGAENQTLRDILIGEEERKYDASMKDLNEGETGTQLADFQHKYGDRGMDQTEYFDQQFGAYQAEDDSVAGEEAAAAGAAGRVPIQPGTEDEGKAYFGW